MAMVLPSLHVSVRRESTASTCTWRPIANREVDCPRVSHFRKAVGISPSALRHPASLSHIEAAVRR